MDDNTVRPTDVRDIDLVGLDDGQFGMLTQLVAAEQQRRALMDADPAALIAEAFRGGFGEPPVVLDPWVRNGLLVAPGGRFDRGPRVHRCSFVKVGEHWVWEHPTLVEDEIRRPGPGLGMRSVTVVALSEGERVDLVSARCRDGVHRASSVRSFVYNQGRLDLVDTRRIQGIDHR
jgi:hypothetical protein